MQACIQTSCDLWKIIHTPPHLLTRMVNGNSYGIGGLKGRNFQGLWEGAQEKNFAQGYKRHDRSYETFLSICGLFFFDL